MIEYQPCIRTRNDDTMAKLREMAENPEISAERLYARLTKEVGAAALTMRLIHGGRWSIRVSHLACLISIARNSD